MFLSTSQLTNGEKLFILRRRDGNTQAREAALRNLPLSAYKKLEGDEECAYSLTAGKVGKLLDYEACVAQRRRKGLSLDILAEKIGLTKWWLCQIERGKAPVDSLFRFWETGCIVKTAKV